MKRAEEECAGGKKGKKDAKEAGSWGGGTGDIGVGNLIDLSSGGARRKTILPLTVQKNRCG